MPATASELELTDELVKVHRRLYALEQGKALKNASIDGASLPVYTADGKLRMTVGVQPDQTYGTQHYAEAAPPKPGGITVVPGAGGISVASYGTTEDGTEWPLDFSHFEVHLGITEDFELSPATLAATFETTEGGIATVAGLDPALAYYVKMVAVNLAGLHSDPTAAYSAIPVGTPGIFFNNVTAGDPVPTAESDTDLWMKPDEGYAMFRWDGADWVAAPLGTDALEDGAITSDKVAASYVYAGNLSADQITTGALAATLSIVGELVTAAENGRAISISSSGGIRAIDPSGDLVVHIPTDLDTDISLQADLVAKSITALGSVAMRAQLNELAQNATLILRSATSAPVSPPTVALDWFTSSRDPGAAAPGTYYGAYSLTSYTYVAWNNGSGSSGIHIFNNSSGSCPIIDTLVVGNPSGPEGAMDAYSVAFEPIGTPSNGTIHVHVRRGTNWYWRRYDLVTKALLSEWPLGSDTKFAKGLPCITLGQAAGNIEMIFADGNGNLRHENYNKATGALISSTDTGFAAPTPPAGGDNPFPGALRSHVVGFVSAQGDYNDTTTRLSFMIQGLSRVYVLNRSTYAELVNDEWPTAFNQQATSLTFINSSTRYWMGMSVSTGRWHRYDGALWGAESSTWYVTNTWRDNDTAGDATTHESTQGPPAVLTMSKRARLLVTTPPIPSDTDPSNHNDPNSVSIYVGRVDGGRTTQYRQSRPATGSRNATLTDVDLTFHATLRPNPPAAGDFPVTDVPSKVYSQETDANGPLFSVDGKGAGRWKAIAPELFGFTFAGPWSGAVPGATTGQVFTLTKACDVLITTTATAYTVNAAVGIFMDVYVDGVVRGQMNLQPTLIANVRLTLAPTVFKVTGLAAGNHYVAFRANSGSSAAQDVGTIHIVATPV